MTHADMRFKAHNYPCTLKTQRLKTMWNKKYCRLEKIHFFNPWNGLVWLHLFVQNLRKNKWSTQRQCCIGYELYSCVFCKSWHDLPVSVFAFDEGFHMKSQPGELHQWETGEFFCALCWHILSQSPLWTRQQLSYLPLFWFQWCEHTLFATGGSSSCKLPLSGAATPRVCSWCCAPGRCAVSCGYLEMHQVFRPA